MRPTRAAAWVAALASALGPVSSGAQAPAALGGPGPACDAQAACEWWVDLSEPPLGRRDAPPDVQARLRRQQDQVMAALRSIGGVEIGRVSLVRNAIAVRLPGEALAGARRIDGVVRLSPVRHRHRHDAPAQRPSR